MKLGRSAWFAERVVEMARFMVKVLLLICTLLFGMLLGIQQAEHGIFSILGVHSPFNDIEDNQEEIETNQDTQPKWYIKRIEGEEVEVGFVGDPFTLEELEEKEEQWLHSHTHNRYSKIGSTLGELVYSVSQKGAQWFATQLDKLL